MSLESVAETLLLAALLGLLPLPVSAGWWWNDDKLVCDDAEVLESLTDQMVCNAFLSCDRVGINSYGELKRLSDAQIRRRLHSYTTDYSAKNDLEENSDSGIFS